ncbi:MAG TPA: LysM peptidoglycan-binding domain-containing protein [Anaerolineae bacterium]|nr:LysM peptidoglycan-binding domain-containing protein [Anaerolineae bacterium]
MKQLLASRYVQIGLALFIAVVLIAGMSSSAAAAGPVYHTVQYGQTLYSIAMHYGTSVWAIACANGLYNPNYVYAGQVLKIPQGWDGGGCQQGYKPVKHDGYGCGGCDGGYQPPKYDGCSPCDGGYQPPKRDGYGCNPCDGGYPAKWSPYPGPKFGCYYTVRWGDDLFRIGLKYGVSWIALANANGLYNGNYIYAGQVLRVPCVW